MPVDPSLLRDISFFRLLDDRERTALAAVLDEVHLPAGQVVYEYGDPGDSMYVLCSGSVDIYVDDNSGTRIPLGRATAGEVVGEISMLDHGPRTASVVTTAAVRALRVDRDDLEQFLQYHPTVALDLLTVVGQRLRQTAERLRHTTSRNVNVAMADRATPVERVTDWVANFSGSLPFLALNAAIFIFWIVVNTDAIPWLGAFDPFPFQFLTMAVSLEAIFLATFVLISQNRQAAKDHVRADIEYDVNLKAELEVAHLHDKLDRMNAELQQRLQHIEQGMPRELLPHGNSTGPAPPGVPRP